MNNEIHLSKRLSWLLRHGAKQEGLHIQPNGFVDVNAILTHPKYASDFNLEKLKLIVGKDKKQRYTLRQNSRGQFEIRANQGHSLDEVKSSDCLERVQNAEDIKSEVVHGTYYRYWPNICREGLRPMQRLHVHFAMLDYQTYEDKQRRCTTLKYAGRSAPVSGFRSDCELLIYLDVRKAMVGGMEIYRSANNVILSSGFDGCIPKEYFLKVIDRRTGTKLNF